MSTKQVTAGEIPEFYATAFEEFGHRFPAVSNARQSFLALRNLHGEHRNAIDELAADLRVPHENRRRLSDQIAAETTTKLSKLKEQGLAPARQELKRARYQRDYTSQQIGVESQRMQFLWQWLQSAKPKDREQAISNAMREPHDFELLASALLMPKAVGLLEDGKRERIGALVNPASQVEVEQLEQALDMLSGTARMIESEVGRASDAELRRRREVGEKLIEEMRARQEQAEESGGPTLDPDVIAAEVKEILKASDLRDRSDLEQAADEIAGKAFGGAA